MSFDLNINNYSLKELEDMFDLSDTSYDSNIVEKKEKILKENINNNTNIDYDTKVKTINFIFKVKDILINNLDANKNTKFQDIALELYNASFDMKKTNIRDSDEHMVQFRTDKPYLSSYPSEFFPGIINPIKKKINRINLNIDTRFRDNYYATLSSNFNITLPIQLNNVLTMQLSALELPKSFYIISKQLGNNFFTITANLIGNEPISNVVEIPDGNYTNLELMSVINSQMVNFGGVFEYIVFNVNITSTNSGSGQTYVGIVSTYAGPTIEYSLNFQYDRFGIDDRNTPLPLKFGWLLGFRNGLYVNNGIYVSEGIIDLTSIKYLYLAIDDHNNSVNNNFYGAFNNSMINKNILARISLQSSPLFTIFTENNFNIVTQPRQYYGPVNILNMNIQLLDEYGRVINLNNMDYSFCLTFQTVYDI